MSDATILYTGMFCFSLIFLAFILTMREFRKMAVDEQGRLPAPERRVPIEARTH